MQALRDNDNPHHDAGVELLYRWARLADSANNSITAGMVNSDNVWVEGADLQTWTRSPAAATLAGTWTW